MSDAALAPRGPSRDRATILLARAAMFVVGISPFVVTLTHTAFGRAGDALDEAFVFVCHRLPERTLSLAGTLMPICSRCAGIFAGVAIAALLGSLGLSQRAWRRGTMLASALMVIDVVTQDVGLHAPNHVTRLATGIFFGLAATATALAWARSLEEDDA
jgi:uncharacterized membrane protein